MLGPSPFPISALGVHTVCLRPQRGRIPGRPTDRLQQESKSSELSLQFERLKSS